MLKEKELKSLLVIVAGLLVAYFVFGQKFIGLIYAAAGIGVISLLIPIVGVYIVKLWFKIAEVLGWINSRILLSLLYYLLLTPISFLYRLTKKDTLTLKSPKDSIYTERNYTYKPKDLDNTW